jgi:phasin family protein
MTDNTNPFRELEEMLKQWKVPGIDLDSVMASYRKNMDALTEAGRLAAEGMKTLAERQTQIMRDSMETLRGATAELTSSKDPQEFATKQAEVAKQAFEKASANLKELADMVVKSNTASFEVIQARMNQGLTELQDLMHGAIEKAEKAVKGDKA